jgi:hypothetical protein
MMPYLSIGPEESTRELEGAVPVAIVKSSDPHLDGWVLYAHNNDDTRASATASVTDLDRRIQSGAGASSDEVDLSKMDALLGEDLAPRARAKMLEKMTEAAKSGVKVSTCPEPLREAYRKLKSHYDAAACSQSVQLPIGSHFELLPALDELQRKTMYVAAPSGAGKSVVIANYLRKVQQLHPAMKIYVLSKADPADDPAFRGIRYTRLPISTLLEGPLDVTKCFGGPAVLAADDIDSFEGAEFKACASFIKDALNMGRKVGLHTIVSNHLLTDYTRTRGIINETQTCVVFPSHTMASSLTYFCSKIGLDKDAIARVKGLKSRWVAIHKSAPMYVVGEHSAFIL